MDRHIKEDLEEYMRGAMGSSGKAAFEQRLDASDEETRQMVAMFQQQAEMIRQAYKPLEEVAPAPGFYGRVMDRIQAQRSTSIWAVFLEPQFFKRLAFASAALFILLSLTMVTTTNETDEALLATESLPSIGAPMDAMAGQEPAPLGASQEQDRNVILVNLATYQE